MTIPLARDPEAHFCDRIARIIYKEAGIILSAQKAGMIRARLCRRLGETGCKNLADYVAFLDGPKGRGEIPEMVSALTTNVTSFFRENHHFETLATDVLSPALKERRALHIWSAGCSSGQEPYSIAMTAAKVMGLQANNLVQISATDIDRQVIERGRAARYTAAEMGALPSGPMRGFIQKSDEMFQIVPQVAKLVNFRILNLHGIWNDRPHYDAIFCRNVVIYFDEPSQHRLWTRLIGALRPGGWLFIGHSERIPPDLRDNLEPAGTTTYRKSL